MTRPTTTCPACGRENRLPFRGQIAVYGNTGMGIAVECGCGNVFDATGGQDGTYDVVDGGLRLRDAVTGARTAILTGETAVSDVRDFIEGIRQGTDEAPPEDPRLAGIWTWLHTHPVAKQYTAPVIVAILLLVLTQAVAGDDPEKAAPPPPVTVVVDTPDDPELRKVVETLEALRQELERTQALLAESARSQQAPE